MSAIGIWYVKKVLLFRQLKLTDWELANLGSNVINQNEYREKNRLF